MTLNNGNFQFKTGHIVDVRDNKIRPYQIKVPNVHQFLAAEMLPWARVLNFGGGSFDSGGQPMFVKGATVGILFEDGNIFKPIIIGGIQKDVGETQEYASEIFPDEGTYKPTENRPVEMPNDGPIESLTPGVYTLYKSPKGATIVVSEAPEAEYFKLIDRAGQEIEMVSPVTNASNTNNGAQRGDREAGNEEALPYSDIKEEAYIRVTDLSGNQFELYSKQGEERILIKNNAHNNTLEFNKDGLFINILNGKTGGGLTIEGTAEGLKVNGQYLATESLVEWLEQSKTNLGLAVKPGNPVPIFPSRLVEFLTKRISSINNEGLKSQLI